MRPADIPIGLDVWNAVNAIVRKPIEYEETSALGFDTADDQFSILQGDIVQTEAAYFYGERIATSAQKNCRSHQRDKWCANGE